jgi:predicted ribosome-associated RNA-binding protein Tma20
MIGNKTIKAIANQLEKHMQDYMVRINEAYEEAEDGVLTISMKAKITPYKDGTKVVTSIAFVEKKVSDSGIVFVDENQLQLFEVTNAANKKGGAS